MYTKKSQRETQRVEKEWVEAPFMLGQILRVCLLKSMVCIWTEQLNRRLSTLVIRSWSKLNIFKYKMIFLGLY